MSDELTHESYNPLIHTVAESWRRRFHPYVERGDLVQELLTFWYANPRVITKALDSDEEKVRVRNIGRRLNDVANAFCRSEKAAALGYSVDDEAFYPPALLEELLPAVLSGDWTPPQVEGGGSRTADPAEGNTYLATMLDVSGALSGLNDDDLSALRLRYDEGKTLEECAAYAEVPVSTMSSRIHRSLRRMSDALGGERPQFREGPGTRRVIPNSSAQAVTSNQEDG